MGDAGSACSVTLPGMLVELSVVEQRYQAVLAVAAGLRGSPAAADTSR